MAWVSETGELCVLNLSAEHFHLDCMTRRNTFLSPLPAAAIQKAMSLKYEPASDSLLAPPRAHRWKSGVDSAYSRLQRPTKLLRQPPLFHTTGGQVRGTATTRPPTSAGNQVLLPPHQVFAATSAIQVFATPTKNQGFATTELVPDHLEPVPGRVSHGPRSEFIKHVLLRRR